MISFAFHLSSLPYFCFTRLPPSRFALLSFHTPLVLLTHMLIAFGSIHCTGDYRYHVRTLKKKTIDQHRVIPRRCAARSSRYVVIRLLNLCQLLAHFLDVVWKCPISIERPIARLWEHRRCFIILDLFPSHDKRGRISSNCIESIQQKSILTGLTFHRRRFIYRR